MDGVALSVNLNKYALLRNSRGQGVPDLQQAARTVLDAGAHGITLHPRMDQRHVRFEDVPRTAAWLDEHAPGIELNIECEDHPYLLELVLDQRPAQVTLVPVDPGEITSSHGWELPRQTRRLQPTVARLRNAGLRVSAFVDPEPDLPPQLAAIGVHRIEIYTGPYAAAWGGPEQEEQRQRIFATARAAVQAGLEVNAGHDLDRHNLVGLRGLPGLCEVSIGHAQICRALQVGTRQSVQELLAALGA